MARGSTEPPCVFEFQSEHPVRTGLPETSSPAAPKAAPLCRSAARAFWLLMSVAQSSVSSSSTGTSIENSLSDAHFGIILLVGLDPLAAELIEASEGKEVLRYRGNPSASLPRFNAASRTLGSISNKSLFLAQKRTCPAMPRRCPGWAGATCGFPRAVREGRGGPRWALEVLAGR
eukprot:CAMPEP_0206253296 /NCGR_PEP_ID=MMETSP0047_2-20121206/23076_1 /ASSEMBLY_ACC=CAM_ASM_000192 /TAXON_ID=195065 /ORGANISM="Chroomonas mesostigmatica_cf, Strain CCMP1168" /LENGTH=174 /DNA_ID=CAMNT_0053679495 /DNA_START=334 /DNA_END=858 /DNA_ORIENTATION=-